MEMSLNDGQFAGPNLSFNELVVMLGAHMTGVQSLSEAEMFLLKSWLVLHSEACDPGHVVVLQDGVAQNGCCDENHVFVVAGKLPSGDAVVWHKELPWPDELREFFAA